MLVELPASFEQSQTESARGAAALCIKHCALGSALPVAQACSKLHAAQDVDRGTKPLELILRCRLHSRLRLRRLNYHYRGYRRWHVRCSHHRQSKSHLRHCSW